MNEQPLNTIDTGLAQVPVCTSNISYTTMGKDGIPILLYRGYSIYDLVKGLFEESVYALLYGNLPDQNELEEFDLLLKKNMNLNEKTLEVLRSFPKNAHLMDLTLTALSYERMFDQDYENEIWRNIKAEQSARSNLLLDAGIRFGAKIPAIFSYGYRIINNEKIITPDENLTFAANILSMLGIELEQEFVDALNKVLILYLDHTINCSTFTSLVTESSGVDPYGPHLAASVALKGVLHGGANDLAAKMFDEIEKPADARNYILNKLKNKEIIFGFGHRLTHYKGNVESRVRITESICRPLAEQRGFTDLMKTYDIVKETMIKEKGRAPNLDLPVAVLFKIIGIPEETNTPIFQASRHFGWIANMKRQRDAKAPLYRPTQVYTGIDLDEMKTYLPLKER